MDRRRFLAALATAGAGSAAGCAATNPLGLGDVNPPGEAGRTAATGPVEFVTTEFERTTLRVTPRAAMTGQLKNFGSREYDVTVRATFFNERGSKLTTKSETMLRLGVGEVWEVYVTVEGDIARAASRAEFSVSTSTEQYSPPEGPTLVDHRLSRGWNTATVSGTVRNEGDASVETLTAFVKFSGDSDHVVGSGTATVRDLAPDETWEFSVPLDNQQRAPGASVVDHEVILAGEF